MVVVDVHEDPGRWGEHHARQLLVRNGWHCCAERWRCRYGDIDLLMVKAAPSGLRLLAVEVKARQQKGVDGWGLKAFNNTKRQRLKRALVCWQTQHPWSWHVGFEVVLVLVPLPPASRPVRWIRVPELGKEPD